MKYLFLLIRHMFPRKRWVTYRTTNVTYDGMVSFILIFQRDQFGNERTKKVNTRVSVWI